MKTEYYKSKKEVIKAVKAASKADTYIKEGSFRCDCGESYAVYQSTMTNLDLIKVFIDCKACYNEFN